MRTAKLPSVTICTLLLFVLVAGCVPPPSMPAETPGMPPETTAEAGPPPEPHGLRPDAPPYGVRGPYAVGVRHFEIDASRQSERPLTVTLWYPAQNPEGLPEEYTYEMGFAPGAFPLIAIYGHAIEGAAPATAGGPYPLVVYSHAHWSFSQEIPYFTEHLVSHGFVVISADHQDNWSTAFGPTAWQTEFQRPDEVRRQIDYAESLTAADGPLEGLIDTDRVGVAGWSYGGQTALMAGGARLDMAGFRAWCEENTVGEKPPLDDCVDILPYEEELAALAGLDGVPPGLWPDWGDERVDAVVALAPPIDVLGAEGVRSVDVPVMFLIGSDDPDVGPLYVLNDPYQRVTAGRKAEIVFDHAGHLVFYSSCADAPGAVDLGFHAFCSDLVWDMDRAHDLVNHFATAFLLAELKGDADAAATLAPEAVDFPGINYRAEWASSQ